MFAAEIARALGDETREGNEWRCRCPVHGGRSLLLRDGKRGVVWHCFGGCSGAAIFRALSRLRLLGGRRQP